MDTKTALSKSIREQRQRKGWTQAELAERLAVNSASTVGNWENGIATPDVERLSLMADLFEVSVDKLLGRVTCAKPVIPASDEIDPNERELFKTMWEWFIDLDDAGQRTVYNCIEFQHGLIMEAGPKAPKRRAKERYQPLLALGYGDEICLLFVREIFGRGLNDKVPCKRLYDEIEAFLKDRYFTAPLPKGV